MNVMTAPQLWDSQDRMLTVEDMEMAQVTGEQPYQAAGPFPVTVVPASLVARPAAP